MCEKPISVVERPQAKSESEKRLGYRAGAGIVVLLSLSILAVAAWIEPAPSGVGSHTQLGFRACAFYERTGYPCISCGMTTAFAHVVRGELLRAFEVQPAGALAGIACILTAILAGLAAATGRGRDKFTALMNIICVHWAVILMAIAAVVLTSWLWTCALTYFRTH